MLAVALTLALSSSSGGLLAEHLPRGVRLLDAPQAPPLVAAPDDLRPGDYREMSLPDLKAAFARFEQRKPSAALGTTLLVTGVVLLVGGLVVALVGAFVPDVLSIVLGLVAGAAGVALVITGPILMSRALRQRIFSEKEQEAIKKQMQLLEGGPAAPPVPRGPSVAPPPPPPPPPPMSGREVTVPMVTLLAW